MIARIAISLGAVGMAVGLAASARADAPAGQYQISNGTVYDTRTKLTWQQAVQGKSPAYYTWDAAKTYCAGLSLGGMVGWRLPTVKELWTLMDLSVAVSVADPPLIDPDAFPSTGQTYFSSSSLDSEGSVLSVHFGFPILGRGTGNGSSFRCVR